MYFDCDKWSIVGHKDIMHAGEGDSFIRSSSYFIKKKLFNRALEPSELKSNLRVRWIIVISRLHDR